LARKVDDRNDLGGSRDPDVAEIKMWVRNANNADAPATAEPPEDVERFAAVSQVFAEANKLLARILKLRQIRIEIRS
jgi:hypothetical protein